ncbi:RdgB/HAM1 family non-canonical purine NTP pyrophosphatase [Nitrosomonas eutropha]|uniref:dITP/XTP pyrophosphatase n=2 Tax=Nitrosomonas eutropha TaxID=916 RepID=A0ABX5M5K6_9PROT|nr:RdgB/HAM1 family non-canonical purine NTP pyrophosphatase [Nitrosomonas eutropha]ABI58593.1 non-canonical purine NTP pyrophosphatase, rdgB/HAM1 family protein [Nitrosomonas eutropha C91]PXV79727.1 XTP/dITP diphosphohydrolase [Nitrosomonas eutropha]SEJ02851.1 XTP/dITP diphosphohydrolase [Nitrosomonas eutropha]
MQHSLSRIVIASNNAGKLAEIGKLLAPLGIEVVTQASLGVTEADEPHMTFVENALAKARHASLATGLPALADDSGICVNALQGAPGVLSARYAGEPRSDKRNNRKLVEALHGQSDHRAYYYCVIILLRHGQDPQPVIIEDTWHGEIIAEPKGQGGFGYDPHFFLPKLGKTAAELSMEEKNKISHRGKALARLVQILAGNEKMPV